MQPNGDIPIAAQVSGPGLLAVPVGLVPVEADFAIIAASF